MKRILTGLLISITALFVMSSAVIATSQDYLTYTEYDPSAKIDVDTTVITAVGFNGGDGYVYKDLGSPVDRDFTAEFQFSGGNYGSDPEYITAWALTSSIGYPDDATDRMQFVVQYTGGYRYCNLISDDGSTTLQQDNSYPTFLFSNSTVYDVLIEYDSVAATLTATIYNEAKTVTYDTLQVDVLYTPSLQYLYAIADHSGTDNSADLLVEDLDFTIETISPSVSTGTAIDNGYNAFSDWFSANITGNVVYDGGEEITGTFYWRDETDNSSWFWANTIGTYATGENFTAEIYPLEQGHTYQYFARATNSVDYDDGSTANITISDDNIAPDIQTLAYPISLNADNLTATIYGQVIYDGGDDVNASFLWREYASANWTSTNTTSNLSSLDLFSANLTDLSLDTVYQYYATGNNSYGSDNGSIWTFTLTNITQPDVDTKPADFVRDTSAYLYAHINDDGGDDGIIARFQYRIEGATTWLFTSITNPDVNGDYSIHLTGLTPETNYEFRAYVKASLLGGVSYDDTGDVLGFRTLSTNSVPIMITDNGTLLTIGVMGLDCTVYYDGGSDVTVWAQYRIKGTSTWYDGSKIEGVTSGEFGTSIVSGLQDETYYQYRAVGQNSIGTGNGSIRQFYISYENGITDDTSGTPKTGIDPIDLLNTFLNKYGLDNPIGYWLSLIASMALVFIVFFPSAVLRILMPLLVLGFFIVAKLVDQWLVILLAIPAGLLLVWIFKKGSS